MTDITNMGSGRTLGIRYRMAPERGKQKSVQQENANRLVFHIEKLIEELVDAGAELHTLELRIEPVSFPSSGLDIAAKAQTKNVLTHVKLSS